MSCEALCRDGRPCRFAARAGTGLCGIHRRAADACSICHDHLVHDVRQLACGHAFHRACVRAWFRQSLTCPLCRVACPDQAHIAFRTLLSRVRALGCQTMVALRAVLARVPWLRRQREYILSIAYQAFTLDLFYEYLRRLRA